MTKSSEAFEYEAALQERCWVRSRTERRRQVHFGAAPCTAPPSTWGNELATPCSGCREFHVGHATLVHQSTNSARARRPEDFDAVGYITTAAGPKAIDVARAKRRERGQLVRPERLPMFVQDTLSDKDQRLLVKMLYFVGSSDRPQWPDVWPVATWAGDERLAGAREMTVVDVRLAIERVLKLLVGANQAWVDKQLRLPLARKAAEHADPLPTDGAVPAIAAVGGAEELFIAEMDRRLEEQVVRSVLAQAFAGVASGIAPPEALFGAVQEVVGPEEAERTRNSRHWHALVESLAAGEWEPDPEPPASAEPVLRVVLVDDEPGQSAVCGRLAA